MAASRKQQTKKSNSNKRTVMENTIENKERLFGQHWGQNVFRHSTSSIVYKVDRASMQDIGEKDYLELTPLSQITNEDAKKVASIVLGKEIEPLDYYIDEAAELYATEVAKAQRKACAEYVYDSILTPRGNKIYAKAHTLSTPLVTDKPG